MTYWIKLYTEILNDPKVGRLSNELKWRFTEALLLAGSEEQDGYLPEAGNAAFMAHTSEDELLKDWRALAAVGLLAETPDGWLVVNFAKRQAPSDSAERVKLHRERKELLQRYSNVTVTTPESDTETDTDTETELRDSSVGGSGEFVRVKNLIEQHTGMPSTPRDVPAIQKLVDLGDVEEADIITAIAWHRDNGRVVYGASHLLGSIEHNRAARIQQRARASPANSNGRVKRTGAIAAERERLRKEREANNGNE